MGIFREKGKQLNIIISNMIVTIVNFLIRSAIGRVNIENMGRYMTATLGISCLCGERGE